MDQRLFSNYAEAKTFPAFDWDATTLGISDQVRRDLPGWRDFEVARADSITVIWIVPLLVERKERRSLGHVTATGTSEVTVLPITLDATEDSGDGIAVLEIAAETGDEEVFVRAANEIDWSQRPATDLAQAVRLALATGAHLLARKLADYGHRLYPHYEELAKMARILAPPRVVRTDIPPAPSLQANQEWLRVHGDEYRGQWVALRDGILLATAATTRQLRAYLESTDGVLITKVF